MNKKSFVKYGLALVKEGNFDYDTTLKLNNPKQVYEIAKQLNLQNKPEEELWLVCVDVKNSPIGLHLISKGNLNSSIASPREIFKRVILNNAFGFFLIHNHPSGDVNPSNDDIKITTKIKECASLFDIEFLDHVVVGGNIFYSIRESGLVWF